MKSAHTPLLDQRLNSVPSLNQVSPRILQEGEVVLNTCWNLKWQFAVLKDERCENVRKINRLVEISGVALPVMP